jgi:glycosyltransferase involved in cell wall biosynthesis
VRRELSISDEEFCIGCVGNLTLVKDHLTILKALDQFNRSCRSWRLILIGDGPERLKIESYVHSRKDWSGRVSFLGLSDQVPELLNAFDVFVMASLTEGISNSLLEAMATGIPVIATDTGGNPEVVVDNESGLLFPVGDFRQLCNLLNSLWNDRELRTRLARAAQTRATQSFSIDTMVALYQQVYGSLVAECGPGTPRAALAGLRGEVE